MTNESAPQQPEKKPWYKRSWGIILLPFVGVSILLGITGNLDEPEEVEAVATTITVEPETTTTVEMTTTTVPPTTTTTEAPTTTTTVDPIADANEAYLAARACGGIGIHQAQSGEEAAICLQEAYVFGDPVFASRFAAAEVVDSLFEVPYDPPPWSFTGCGPRASDPADVVCTWVVLPLVIDMFVGESPGGGRWIDRIEYTEV